MQKESLFRSAQVNTKSINAVNRYRSIDGMRGIAALGVVVFHLAGNLKPELSKLLPEFVNGCAGQ